MWCLVAWEQESSVWWSSVKGIVGQEVWNQICFSHLQVIYGGRDNFFWFENMICSLVGLGECYSWTRCFRLWVQACFSGIGLRWLLERNVNNFIVLVWCLVAWEYGSSFWWRSVNVIVGHEVLKLLSSHILKQLVEVIMMSCGLGVRIFFWWGSVNVIVGRVVFKLFSSHVFKQFLEVKTV